MTRTMKHCAGLISIVLLASVTSSAQSALRVGDDAPVVSVTKWIKGGPLSLDEVFGKKVVVLEFWATWCGPCIHSIPHLTELQKEYSERDVVVIGVTRPDKRNSLDAVRSFTEKKGDEMGYTVAFDGESKTYDAYMTASGARGIPTSFLIDKSKKLVWIGHPQKLDNVLDEVLAGTFDMELEWAKRVLRERMRRDFGAKKFADALRVAEALTALTPDDLTIWNTRISLYRKLGQMEKLGPIAQKVVTLARDNAALLNMLSWTLLTEKGVKGRFNPLALAAAERCHELTEGENWAYMDTLALARFETGDRKRALELQQQAVAMAQVAKASEKVVEDLRSRLKLFEKAAASATKASEF